MTRALEANVEYEEFEKKILEIVYKDGIDRLLAEELAFAFDLDERSATQHLESAVSLGILDVDFVDGVSTYYVPGLHLSTSPDSTDSAMGTINETTPSKENDNSGADGALDSHGFSSPNGMDGSVKSSLVLSFNESIGPPLEGPTGKNRPTSKSREMVLSRADLPATIVDETGEDLTFSNASRTMFNRKIRIPDRGISEEELSTRVTNLFRSFGYSYIENKGNTIRFERGSVTFLIALIPLFVLILPMFVYFFLSLLGRSTIRKEPLLLDVTLRRTQGLEKYWEIDMNFLGLHGVVLGPADQKVLNQEIDTLKEDLMYAFAHPIGAGWD